MWTARFPGSPDSNRFEPAQLSGQPVTVNAIRRVLDETRAREWPVPEMAYANLSEDIWSREAVPGFTAIETYADQAVEEYRGSGELARSETGVRWSPAGHAATLAWHDHSVCVVPVPADETEVLVQYVEEPEDRDREALLTGEHRFFTQHYVDWRLYGGRNSVIEDGESFLRPRSPGCWSARIRLPRGLPGVLVGKVNRRLGPVRSVYDEDDSQASRLRRWESDHPAIATKYPQLGQEVFHDRVGVVFVHGTYSCGICSLVDLDGSLSLPLRRYEHDTFCAVGRNADELARLITSTVRLERLLLFGHSRGGLVARLAASELRKTGWDGATEVWTFGTPHNGTALVGRGLELLLQRLGKVSKLRKVGRLGLLSKIDVATDELGRPREDSVGALLSIMTRTAALPSGLMIMAPDSSERDMFNRIAGTETRYAVGGTCTVDDVHGFGVFHAGFAHEMFQGEPNDMVVDLASSTAANGSVVLPRPCPHSGYFRDATVRGLIP